MITQSDHDRLVAGGLQPIDLSATYEMRFTDVAGRFRVRHVTMKRVYLDFGQYWTIEQWTQYALAGQIVRLPEGGVG